MDVHATDWPIVFGRPISKFALGFYTKKYKESVAELLMANRGTGC